MSQAIVPPSAVPFSAPAINVGGINGLGSLRFVGTTNGGAPTSGTYNTGDVVLDTLNYILWLCTSGGSPGTWVQITAFSANNLNVGGTSYPGSQSAQPNTVVVRDANGIDNSVAFAPTGLTGATSASRYVGATTSGAPTSGAFNKGDFVVDQTGMMWICIQAGSPGTWRSVQYTGSQTFTSSSTFTVPPGVYRIFVQCWGGGGGGGSGWETGTYTTGGSGGDGGGYVEGWLNVSPGQNISVTVGAGGAGGAANGNYGNPGTSGGNSSVLTLTATGGNGGQSAGYNNSSGTNSSPGGSGSGGVYAATGGTGMPYYSQNGSYNGSGGAGATPLGGAGGGFGGHNGSFPGGGGGAANSSSGSGGNGAPGQVIIWW